MVSERINGNAGEHLSKAHTTFWLNKCLVLKPGRAASLIPTRLLDTIGHKRRPMEHLRISANLYKRKRSEENERFAIFDP